MTPYKVNTTWVDLEHVQAIHDPISTDFRSGWTVGRAVIAFQDKPVEIGLGHTSWDDTTQTWVENVNAKVVWDQFIAAWRARTTPSI